MSALVDGVALPAPVFAASTPRLRSATRCWPPSLRSHTLAPPRTDDLLGAVSAGQDDRVLIIGEATTDTLCDAMRRGCRGGAAFRIAPAHPDPVEVVAAPAVRTEEAGQAIAVCARRALPAGGRLVLRAIGQGAAELACSIASRLRTYGFQRVRLHRQSDGALVLGRLPGGSKLGKAC